MTPHEVWHLPDRIDRDCARCKPLHSHSDTRRPEACCIYLASFQLPVKPIPHLFHCNYSQGFGGATTGACNSIGVAVVMATVRSTFNHRDSKFTSTEGNLIRSSSYWRACLCTSSHHPCFDRDIARWSMTRTTMIKSYRGSKLVSVRG